MREQRIHYVIIDNWSAGVRAVDPDSMNGDERCVVWCVYVSAWDNMEGMVAGRVRWKKCL
jgi:hypothetical protein